MGKKACISSPVGTAPADVLALYGAAASAATGRTKLKSHIDGLVQERRNSIANALELHLSCTKPLICIEDQILVG